MVEINLKGIVVPTTLIMFRSHRIGNYTLSSGFTTIKTIYVGAIPGDDTLVFGANSLPVNWNFSHYEHLDPKTVFLPSVLTEEHPAKNTDSDSPDGDEEVSDSESESDSPKEPPVNFDVEFQKTLWCFTMESRSCALKNQAINASGKRPY